jgi:hypothetical protein
MLEDLHTIIQICLGWKDSYRHRFFIESGSSKDRDSLDDKMRIWQIFDQGINELQYEYGTKWYIKVILLSSYTPEKEEIIRCTAGEGAAPPEIIGGPLRFRKILSALGGGSDNEKQRALDEIGPNYVSDLFDLEKCNKEIYSAYK